MLRSLFVICLSVLVLWSTATTQDAPKLIRVGIIGCDTSHCVAFTKILNNPQNTGDLAGIKVVAAFAGGSPDLPDSINRVPGYVAQLQKDFQVEMVPTVEALLSKVDVVLLESVDGRPHWQQAQPVLKANKLVFIDKPVAASLDDAIRIFQLAQQTGTPCFSSSGLRFTPNIAGVRTNDKLGQVIGCVAYSPCALNALHPDLYWYGVHGVETLYTIMGTGCESVQRTTSPGTDVVTGQWRDGRIGTFRGIREGHGEYGALVFGSKSTFSTGSFTGYEPLVTQIARFFRTGKSPVSPEETIEMFAFMQAADISKQRGGNPVLLKEVMQQALQKVNSDK